MKWHLQVWNNTCRYDTPVLWYEMKLTFWQYSCPFHTIWYDKILACFFLMSMARDTQIKYNDLLNSINWRCVNRAPCSTIVWRYGMRKPGSKTGMSPVCENRPHLVYARVCTGMCKMIGRSLLETFVKGGTVSRLCRSELATAGKWGVTSLSRKRRKLNGEGTMSRLRERRDIISCDRGTS